MNKFEIISALNGIIMTGQNAGKWAPRKGAIAARIQKLLNLTPKMYRKAIVAATNVVETQMCAKQWDQINYAHVPSLAAARYQKAFNANDIAGKYAEYKAALESGKTKVNAKAIFPHDVLKGSDNVVVEAQWKALPDYIGEDIRLLPICDVSGSMAGEPMDVCIALGMYIAERNKSAFKDQVLTFHANPTWVDLSYGKTIRDKQNILRRADWGMNTDFEKAYMRILDTAVKNSVPNEDMPTHLIVFSDMQFDAAQRGELHLDNIKNRFAAAGYEVPKIIFWNLRAVPNSAPAQADDNGVALVSGYSPAILKSILACGEFDPVNVMLEALNSERYAQVL